MKSHLGKSLFGAVAAVFAALAIGSNTFAAHTMADWVGQNNKNSTWAPDNNYDIVSPTSIGGQFQSKVNFNTADDPPTPVIPNVNTEFIYLADQSLAGAPLNFKSELHMSGTITFESPLETTPNLCFCWFNGSNTAHRIGLGLSNLATPEADFLRVDFGYGADGGNRFYFVTADGTDDQTGTNAILPNGTYPFSFHYVPGPTGMAGGSMTATVGSYSRTIQPLETVPWDSDTFTFDRFGLVQRSGSTTFQGTYELFLSNVTYTGGSAVPEPASLMPLIVAILVGIRSSRLRKS